MELLELYIPCVSTLCPKCPNALSTLLLFLMNRTYDFSAFNTGNGTNVGFSENMLDADIFGHTATTPLIPQANLNQLPLRYSQVRLFLQPH